MKILALILLNLFPLRVKAPADFAKAGQITDRLYLLQSSGECVKKISSLDEQTRKKFLLNLAPLDRSTGKFFVPGCTCPPGCGNYPRELDLQNLKEAMEKDRIGDFMVSALSPLTVIVRAGEGYSTEPYHRFYADYLGELSTALKNIKTSDPTLKAYLRKRAEELLQDRFVQGDELWLKIEGNLRAYFGPVEVEDPYLGVKMAYGGVVFRILPWKMPWNAGKLLLRMQASLPEKELRKQKPLEFPGIFHAELLAAYGIYRVPPAPSFVVLPPFLPGRAGKYLFLNVIRAKFEKGISRAGGLVENWKGNLPSYLRFLEFHELAHFLNVPGADKKNELSEVFADATALRFAGYLRKAEGGSIEDSYLAHLLYYASRRKKPAVLELNFFLTRGGIKITENGKIEKMPAFKKVALSLWRLSLRSLMGKGELSRVLKVSRPSINLPQESFDFYLEINTINDNSTGGKE